ncbi:ribosomal protein S18-alanine N-acetyltransferase [Shewanella schlegeliana]|uniref:[Ribosomal protein bS18]-alanine N-acetyltransferase n=1 Tax=Shewanella schlegeliana TaxID=190308 RepID=A0ABS1SYQ8_9GAMM|nr:ribosomal protein S18-alanine N-acetyltransferase [Shewanella schlegeliana]MBL4913695.1 ribosomal protein S18-alanine N-acetyltransferase [Shewanella schlegeliana]MCL1108586.1 ribosomal protein S18-alanine N-acetyltransferase [Shewanella schlegeliana]GIU31161.1 ribosomal-protein-alanine acetyltransferase [Shewanella schlegeliana]
MIPIVLSDSFASQMASVAAKAHSHPMSEGSIRSCFGNLYRSFGIFDGETLCGFAILHQIFEDATLMDICVEPGYQGRGFGKALLNAVIAIAKDRGAEVLLLEVRQSGGTARALYEKLGFETTGVRKGYYKTEVGSEDAILMQLSL